jgi:hypothetical protein
MNYMLQHVDPLLSNDSVNKSWCYVIAVNSNKGMVFSKRSERQ